MRRRRKDYKVSTPSQRFLGQPGDLIVNFFDANGELKQSFDFSVHTNRPVMAAELAFAFRNQLADKSEATRSITFASGVRNWFRFLDAHAWARSAPILMDQIDTNTLNAFIGWLNRLPISKGSRHSIWSTFKQLVTWLQRHRSDLV